jgi:hypothetical protein
MSRRKIPGKGNFRRMIGCYVPVVMAENGILLVDSCKIMRYGLTGGNAAS